MEPGPGADEVVESPHHGVRRAIAAVMIVVLVLILIVVVVQIAKDGSSKEPNTAPITGTGSTRVPGITARVAPALAWTGDDLFVFGGTDRRNGGPGKVSNAGARVDVMSGEASALPDAPFAAPLLSPAAVRAGDAIVVMGVECPDYGEPDDSPFNTCAADGVGLATASYDLGTGEWATIASPPDLGSIADGPVEPESGNPYVSWTPQIVGVTDQGRVVVSLDQTGGDVPDYWALTPATKQWRHLGSPGRAFTACIVGDRVMVSTATPARNGDWEAATLRSLRVTAPERGWQPETTIPSAQYPQFGGPRLTCMGTRVMVTGALGEANGGFRVYDAEARTLSTPPPPPPAGQGGAIGARIWNGTELLFINFSPRIAGDTVEHSRPLLPGNAYNPATNTWRTIPGFPVLPSHPIRADAAVVDFTMPEQPLPRVQTSTEPDVPVDTSDAPATPEPIVVHYTPR